MATYADRLVILDEVQRLPGLFQTLRGLIDQYRRAGTWGARAGGAAQVAAPAVLVALPRPDELAHQRVARFFGRAGAVVQRGIGEVLMADRVLAGIPGLDRQRGRQPAADALPADADPLAVDLERRRMLM